MPTNLPPVVVLCGGQGTRLAKVLPEGMPKCLADINGEPFIVLLESRLVAAGFRDIIYATGYGHDKVVATLAMVYRSEAHQPRRHFSRETEPLGTLGAVKLAADTYQDLLSGDFVVVNGDTICDVDYNAILAYHHGQESEVTVACDNYNTPVGVFIFTGFLMETIPTGKNDITDIENKFYTDAPFYDIGTPEGLSALKKYVAGV